MGSAPLFLYPIPRRFTVLTQANKIEIFKVTRPYRMNYSRLWLKQSDPLLNSYKRGEGGTDIHAWNIFLCDACHKRKL